jgi:hypothetical protein
MAGTAKISNFRSTFSFCAEIDPEKILEKIMARFRKISIFLPFISLEIILEFILKIPSQKIGNFKNGFRGKTLSKKNGLKNSPNSGKMLIFANREIFFMVNFSTETKSAPKICNI